GYDLRVGFTSSRCDSSLFIYQHGIEVAYLLIYVNDIVLTDSSTALLQCIISSLHKEFDMTDVGALNYFLGILVTRDARGMFLSQKKYAMELLEHAHMSNCNATRTPVDTESKLGSDGDPVSDSTLYRSLAGGLQYLTFTRPNISYVVQQICLHMHDPREPHLAALKRVLRYIRGTLDHGLQLHVSSTSQLNAYTDADWTGCPVTRPSTYGYCVFLRDNLLSWSAKRQVTLSRSSSEAEYRGVANVVAETTWIRHVRVLHVPSRYQYADIFTKGLPTALLEEFRRYGVSVPALTKDHKGKKSNTPYPGKAIRRIGDIVCEYSGRYQTIWYDEDVYDLRSVENKFPAIAFDDSLTSGETLSCEPMVSSLDDEIDFKISFDYSDDEDYTVIFDKNSFSYKIISTNDLKTDSKNDNEKVNLPLFPSPEPTVSYFYDLDFFKDFENEFPAIVYNDAPTSKSDLLSEQILSPQHIDEFDLNDETSLSEYDKEEQNILYFNNLFLFNIIHPNELKSEKDNDDNEIDIIQSLGGNMNTQGSNMRLETSHDKINKTFKMGSFILELNVDIVAWNYYNVAEAKDLGSKEISTNIGGEFTNLEILKCWSLENFKAAVQHEILLNKSTWRIYRANIRGVSHSNSF
ncbi:ribonuclease H-like domain-containing protein, partial [Tanacetum coccineum]